MSFKLRKHIFYNQAVIPFCYGFLKLPHTDVMLLISSFSPKMGMLNTKKSECTDLHVAEKARVKILCANQMPPKEV